MPSNLKNVGDVSIVKKRPGRQAGSIVVNRDALVQAALAALNDDAKRELVLRNIKAQDRVTENGLKYESFVRFNPTKEQMEERYPDHSLDETYRVRTILYPFQTSSYKYEVLLSNLKGEAMGYVCAECLSIYEEPIVEH